MFEGKPLQFNNFICKDCTQKKKEYEYQEEQGVAPKDIQNLGYVNISMGKYPIYVTTPRMVAPFGFNKKNNQIYRVSKALEFYIEDNPKLNKSFKLYAQRRLTARAWRFAKRFKKSNLFSDWFKLYLQGFFYISSDILGNCRKANKIYEDFLD